MRAVASFALTLVLGPFVTILTWVNEGSAVRKAKPMELVAEFIGFDSLLVAAAVGVLAVNNHRLKGGGVGSD